MLGAMVFLHRPEKLRPMWKVWSIHNSLHAHPIFNTAIAGRIPPSDGRIGSDAIPLFELVQEQLRAPQIPVLLAFFFARKLQCLRHIYIYSIIIYYYIYDAQFLDTLR